MEEVTQVRLQTCIEKSGRKGPLDWRIILLSKSFLNKQDLKVWSGFVCLTFRKRRVIVMRIKGAVSFLRTLLVAVM
jgi:hypothetical protein